MIVILIFMLYDLQTFVFQSIEDFNLFNQLVVDSNEALGKKCRVSTWFRPENPSIVIPSPMSKDEVNLCVLWSHSQLDANFSTTAQDVRFRHVRH